MQELVRRISVVGVSAILLKHLLTILRVVFTAAPDRSGLVRRYDLQGIVGVVAGTLTDKVMLLTITASLLKDFDTALRGPAVSISAQAKVTRVNVS